jgi:hypothetical protein
MVGLQSSICLQEMLQTLDIMNFGDLEYFLVRNNLLRLLKSRSFVEDTRRFGVESRSKPPQCQ